MERRTIAVGATGIAATVAAVSIALAGSDLVAPPPSQDKIDVFNAKVDPAVVSYYDKVCIAAATAVGSNDVLAESREKTLGEPTDRRVTDIVEASQRLGNDLATAGRQLSAVAAPTDVKSLSDRHGVDYRGAADGLVTVLIDMSSTVPRLVTDTFPGAKNDKEFSAATEKFGEAMRDQNSSLGSALDTLVTRAKVGGKATSDAINALDSCSTVFPASDTPEKDVIVPEAVSFHVSLCRANDELSAATKKISGFNEKWAEDKTVREVRDGVAAGYRDVANQLTAKDLAAWKDPGKGWSADYGKLADGVLSSFRAMADEFRAASRDVAAADDVDQVNAAVSRHNEKINDAVLESSRSIMRAKRLAHSPTDATTEKIVADCGVS